LYAATYGSVDELRQKLVELIERRQESLKSASLAVGKNHAYLHQYIHMGKPKRLPEEVRYKLARFLNINEKELREDSINEEYTPSGYRFAYDVPAPSSKDLPVRGRARMGRSGVFFEQGRVHELVERPSFLSGSPDAFAVYAVGDSMEPRYYDGEILYINPAKRAAKGDFVVVELHDGDGLIKRLVDVSESGVTLEQLNPHDLINVPLSEIKDIYRIVGSYTR
jgi:phage repressor protein C with HTH and peptisase S24 domain